MKLTELNTYANLSISPKQLYDKPTRYHVQKVNLALVSKELNRIDIELSNEIISLNGDDIISLATKGHWYYILTEVTLPTDIEENTNNSRYILKYGENTQPITKLVLSSNQLSNVNLQIEDRENNIFKSKCVPKEYVQITGISDCLTFSCGLTISNKDYIEIDEENNIIQIIPYLQFKKEYVCIE